MNLIANIHCVSWLFLLRYSFLLYCITLQTIYGISPLWFDAKVKKSKHSFDWWKEMSQSKETLDQLFSFFAIVLLFCLIYKTKWVCLNISCTSNFHNRFIFPLINLFHQLITLWFGCVFSEHLSKEVTSNFNFIQLYA